MPQKTTEPQPKAPITSAPKSLSHIPKTTSLKSLIKEPETPVQPIYHEVLKQSASFNENDLMQCWEAISKTFEEKAHLKNTMLNCTPVLLDNYQFEVKVHNPAQKEELSSNSVDLLKLLRTRLKNDQIQMRIHIDENIEKKTAYTAVEKFEFLHNINPLLSKLVEEFDLAID